MIIEHLAISLFGALLGLGAAALLGYGIAWITRRFPQIAPYGVLFPWRSLVIAVFVILNSVWDFPVFWDLFHPFSLTSEIAYVSLAVGMLAVSSTVQVFADEVASQSRLSRWIAVARTFAVVSIILTILSTRVTWYSTFALKFRSLPEPFTPPEETEQYRWMLIGMLLSVDLVLGLVQWIVARRGS